MAYRRASSSRSRSGGSRRGVRTGTRKTSRSRVSSRRTSARGTRRTAGSNRTIRLVIEQAAATPAAVVTPSGYAVPDTSVPKRSKF